MSSGEETMEEERWQRLEVWKHADELAFLVYKVTRYIYYIFLIDWDISKQIRITN
jgi:hypothetical protein